MKSDMWFQVFDIRRPKLDVWQQKPDIRCLITEPDIRRLILNTWNQTSNIRQQTLIVQDNSWCLISNVWFFMSDVLSLMSDVWCRIFNVQCLKSDVQCPTSNVSCLIFDTRLPMSEVQCLTSEFITKLYHRVKIDFSEFSISMKREVVYTTMTKAK